MLCHILRWHTPQPFKISVMVFHLRIQVLAFWTVKPCLLSIHAYLAWSHADVSKQQLDLLFLQGNHLMKLIKDERWLVEPKCAFTDAFENVEIGSCLQPIVLGFYLNFEFNAILAAQLFIFSAMSPPIWGWVLLFFVLVKHYIFFEKLIKFFYFIHLMEAILSTLNSSFAFSCQNGNPFSYDWI